jgi:hypothetical protein
MAADRVRVQLELAAKEARAEARALADQLKKTGDAVDDVESAGKRMARALESSADDMVAEIDATRRAVDALDRALGDVDINTADVVSDLKRVGLTAEDIEADAEDLAAALKRVDDVKLHAANAGFDDLDQALGRVDSNGRASSAAIGGIGNAISELPGIGSLGPVAESMGQLAESALEGGENVGKIAMAAGGLAAVGVAMGIISSAMQSMADTDAFNEEQIASFSELVKETRDGLAAINEHFKEAEEIAGRAGGMGPFFEKTKDITGQLIDAGVSYDEFITGVEQGGAKLDVVTGKLEAQRAEMREAATQAQRNGERTDEYERAISDLDNAIEISRETHRNYGSAMSEQDRWNKWTKDSTIAKTEAVGALDAQLRAVPGLTIAEVDADTSKASSKLDDLIGKLRAIGSNATVASVVAATRFRQYATGGRNITEPFIAGENGREIVAPSGPVDVTPAGKTAALLDGAGSVVNNYNVVQHFPAGVRPADVTNATRRYRRIQGPT